jgi:Integrase core domain
MLEKRRILDEFVALTGHHRKHAIRVLRMVPSDAEIRGRSRSRVYNEAVRTALTVLWEASDRICGKRLKPLLAVLVPALERHGHLRLDETVRAQVFAVSAATIDRMLAPARAATSGRRSRAKSKPAVRRQIPIRTFADWNDPAPGFLEADLVAHGGESVAGSFTYTFVLTDIASGWTECIPLLVREATLVVDSLERLRTTMPFPLRGIDTDNGSEFVNEALLAYCTKHGIEFTRSRPYRKNDQAWVEQKNGSVVRRLVGYRRLEGIRAAEGLARLYAASRLFVNFFQPSFKLAEKRRVGARVSKRYHAPETPCARLLSSAITSERVKERLRAVMATLDPLRLLDEIRTVQHYLAELAAGKVVHALPHRDADLDRFLKSLAIAWKQGEPRPTHRKDPKPARDWRTRPDPFEAVWPRVVAWLEAEPDRTAKELLERLREDSPEAFTRGHLRTLQRRVKRWRQLAARRLVFADPRPALSA